MNRNLIFAPIMGLSLAVAGQAQGQNLLTNGSFENAGSPCNAGNGWTKRAGTNNCLRDGTTWFPSGGSSYDGSHHGSVDQGGSSVNPAFITQTVTLSGPGDVRLQGAIVGNQSNGSAKHFVRVYNGTDTTVGGANAITGFEITSGNQWAPFDVMGTPSGSEVTVAWGWDEGVSTGWSDATATHADGLVLTLLSPACTEQPTVSSINKAFGPNDATLTGVAVIGTGFDSTSQVVLRRTGFSDVAAINEVTGGGGTSITCDIPLTGVIMGKWNVVVTKDNCDDAVLANGLIVARTTVGNGSFEQNGGPSSCPTPTPSGAPALWLQAGVSTAGEHLGRDSNQYTPGCPRPDGVHYGSILVPTGTSFGYWRAFQYLAVTPNQEVTVCGQFAGGGRTTSYMVLHDGSEDGANVGQRKLSDRPGCPVVQTDWHNYCVSGTSASGLLTLEWRLENARSSGSTVNAVHADNFVLSVGAAPAEVCDNSIDDDGDGRTDCQDSDCAAALGCEVPPVEICDNGIDDDGDLLVDCDDSDCDSVCVEICGNGIDDDQNCVIDDGCEICDNAIDDNGNGLIDCDDPECSGVGSCPAEICDNGIDDDGDLLIDCNDPNCASDPGCICNTPWADADGDTDVDSEDFAQFQQCHTGVNPAGVLPAECNCFDRPEPEVSDGDVDQADFAKFRDCSTGADVPWSQELTPNCAP